VNNLTGVRIRRARHLQAYSQEYVAECIGMSTGNYGKIERGNIQANSKNLRAIAKVLAVDFNYLLDDSEDLKSSEPTYNYGADDHKKILSLESQVKKLYEEQNIMKAQIAQLMEENQANESSPDDGSSNKVDQTMLVDEYQSMMAEIEQLKAAIKELQEENKK
jgi:transcriptional regulator with XRE-family HTH domain